MINKQNPHACPGNSSLFLIRLPHPNASLASDNLIPLVRGKGDPSSIAEVQERFFRRDPDKFYEDGHSKGNDGIFSYRITSPNGEPIEPDQIGQSGFLQCKLRTPVKDTIDWVSSFGKPQILIGFPESGFNKNGFSKLFHAPTDNHAFSGSNKKDVGNSHGVVRLKVNYEDDPELFDREREQLISIMTSHLWIKPTPNEDFFTWA